MAKAKRQSTKRSATAVESALRAQVRPFGERWRQQVQEVREQAERERWRQQAQKNQKQDEELRKSRKLIDERDLGRAHKRNAGPIGPLAAAADPPNAGPIGPVDAQGWITTYLKQMIERNEIPERVRIGKLAELLSKRMHEAAETNKWLKAAGAHYIRSHLREWVATAKLDIKIP